MGPDSSSAPSPSSCSLHDPASSGCPRSSAQFAPGAPGALVGEGGSRLPGHCALLVEPVLLPALHHVHVESPQDLEESCLFYPNGSKNRNIRREIEAS
ncbi:hypothetical protein EON64_13355, partial [archaeon]